MDNIDQNPVLLSTMALATIAVAGIARNTGIADSLFDAFADLISMLPFESYRYYGVSEKNLYTIRLMIYYYVPTFITFLFLLQIQKKNVSH